MRGKLIAFEGPECCGKTTQMANVSARLQAAGIEVVATREPGGTPLCEQIRQLLLKHGYGDGVPREELHAKTELLLFLAARAQHVAEKIEPALAAGKWVLCDRFSASTLAYQGYGRGMDLTELRLLDSFAAGGLVPDLTLVFDVSYETSQKRLAGRSESLGGQPDRIERERRAFHEAVRAGFIAIAADNAERYSVVDGEQDAKLVEAAAWARVRELLEK